MCKSRCIKPVLTFIILCFVVTPFFSQNDEGVERDSYFTIAFGSCNKHNSKNTLWDDVLNQQPNVWIWGGDNIYADTYNMSRLERKYKKQLKNPDYSNLVKHTKVLGTWDDHDYGDNDAEVHFKAKKGSQQLFLDFIGVSKNDERRQQEGIYHSETFEVRNFSV
ncbi:alkaline phosphatase D family protein [Yeosuana sp. MJ-SS3]|uniref:Alkaline phosphatase D family protein n=1 Tax=Gilvirhabdus luticola TaxID=3079858 RepID=A0ABU3U8B3_9FLAO|nr:alkaline phosphatase D family protein [Yeosuana sp. MJ-SS3]MDU8886572.1 alkaline phosphatase D family protein [Yeosuana sp. MJ-SS3]